MKNKLGKMFCPRCHQKMKIIIKHKTKQVEFCSDCGTAYNLEMFEFKNLPEYFLSNKDLLKQL